jgi:hypothetical protein
MEDSANKLDVNWARFTKLELYRPLRSVPKASTTNPTTTNKKALAETNGMLTSVPRTPSTTNTTATHQVTFFGADNLIIIS